jgi:hypothetical protein
MNPRRTTWSPIRQITNVRTRRGRAPRFLGAFAALLLVAAPANATLLGGEASPPDPTICDAVSLVVAGALPDDCHTLRGMRVGNPEPLPTAGPIPAYRIVARVVVEDLNPLLGRPCVMVTQPYKLEADLGRLRFGTYQVEAIEYAYPFPADSTAPRDSSRISFSFFVGADSCRAIDGCVLLGFGQTVLDTGRFDGCTARAVPGGRACFDVTLANPMPVGALQTEIVIRTPGRDTAGTDFFEPVRVEAVGRAGDFEAAWSADGSTIKVVLFSAAGAVIAPGRGPVLHVCESVKGATPEGVYPVHFDQPLVATPEGHAIAFCPTFAPIEGRICVGEAPCDLNGDGVGDVRDILRLVRCILAGTGGSETCPEEIRARADCNRDGVVDVRDLLCCLRRILAYDGSWGPAPSEEERVPTTAPSRLGFAGDVRWINPYEGTATVRIEPSPGFGGLQWVIDPGTAARVRSVSLDDAAHGYGVAWSPNPDGSARVMVYDRGISGGGAAAGAGGGSAAPMAVTITLDPTAGAAAGGALTLRDWRAASWDAGPLAVEPGATRAAMPANAVAGAPSISAARPNPFVSQTEIAFTVPAAGRASLRLFDARGRLVRTLVSGSVAAGVHRASWDGRDARGREVGSGVYFVRLDAFGVTETRRLLRLR